MILRYPTHHHWQLICGFVYHFIYLTLHLPFQVNEYKDIKEILDDSNRKLYGYRLSNKNLKNFRLTFLIKIYYG